MEQVNLTKREFFVASAFEAYICGYPVPYKVVGLEVQTMQRHIINWSIKTGEKLFQKTIESSATESVESITKYDHYVAIAAKSLIAGLNAGNTMIPGMDTDPDSDTYFDPNLDDYIPQVAIEFADLLVEALGTNS
ncbi:MAG: hypothetical protein ACRC62_37500 [Microcoleus sp.]